MITLGENGYVTVDQFKQWASARLIDFSNYSDLQIEAAIVGACLDYIDVNYTFRGCASDSEQMMSLPTNEVAINDVRNPVCHTVFQNLTGKLFVSSDTFTERDVVSESSKLGDLSESVTYADYGARTYTYDTSNIDALFRPFTIGGTGGIGLYRG